MKKFLAANQQQRQQELELEQEFEGQEKTSDVNVPEAPNPTITSGENVEDGQRIANSSASINSSLPLHSHLELLSGMPIIGGMIKQRKSITSQSNGPESPPDAMDFVRMGDSTLSDPPILDTASVVNNESPLPVAMATQYTSNYPTSDISTELTKTYNNPPPLVAYTLDQDEKDERNQNHDPGRVPPSKGLPGQQRNIVLEKRTDMDDDKSSNYIQTNTVTSLNTSVPISLDVDQLGDPQQVPIYSKPIQQSVQQLSITSNTTISSSTTTTSMSNNKSLVGGQSISARNPYQMKKQHVVDNQRNEYQQNLRDFNRSDNISFSANNSNNTNQQQSPSKTSPLQSPTSMLTQSKGSATETAEKGAINPVNPSCKSSMPNEKEFRSVQNVVEPAISMSKSPEVNPLNNVHKGHPTKPKEELTKEEREQQRRNRINAFSEWQKKQKEELAKKDEERKMKQEKRRQEEIAQLEQRKKLKSVRIPKRTKEFSPLVSPNPSSPDTLIRSSSQPEGSISGKCFNPILIRKLTFTCFISKAELQFYYLYCFNCFNLFYRSCHGSPEPRCKETFSWRC